MIVTEQQRRWWFATHPEFSWHQGWGTRNPHDDDDDEDSGRPSPEEVDTMVDERLQHETDKVRRTILELTKYYFGTEFQSKTPAEKEAILREDEDNYWDDDEPPNAAGNERWSDQPVDNKAPDTNKHLTYKDVLDWLDRRQAEEAAKENSAKESFIQEMMKAGWSREKAEDRWKVYKLNEGVASGVADAMNVY